MQLLACGINHKTAPIDIREQLSFNQSLLGGPLRHLVEETGSKEAAILSTCNRTELYCLNSNPGLVIDWLSSHKNLSKEAFQPYLYTYQDQRAVQHILRVAAGLDSMIVGEPQILGQLKNAFSIALEAGTLGKQMHHLAQYVFSASKKIRTETAIGAHSVSAASAAMTLAKQLFADLSQIKVLCIGAGETITSILQYLPKYQIKNCWIANRTLTRAEELSKEFSAKVINLDQIIEVLPEADMIVVATNSSLPIIGKGAVESALKKRKRRLMFMVDLAVPRNIEPEVGDLSDVYLYTLDDLQGIIKQNLKGREEAARHAETIIQKQVDDYMQTLNSQKSNPSITALRQQAENYRDQELAEALRLLENNSMPTEEILKRFAHRLTNKILHAPMQDLKNSFE